MDLPPQIGTWARSRRASRRTEPGTIRLGHAPTATRRRGEGVTLTFAPTRSGAPAPPPARARSLVGADGRDSRVRAAAFGEVLKTRAGGGDDANDANVYYALCPNPPVTERTDS